MSTSFCAAEPVNAAETSSLEAYTQAVMSLWSEHLLCAAHCAKDIGPPSRRRQSDGRGRPSHTVLERGTDPAWD